MTKSLSKIALKGLGTLFVIVLLFCGFAKISNAEDSLPALSSEPAYDETSTLSQSTKDFIKQVNKNYSTTKEKPQIVVAAVTSLDGSTVEEYAYNLFQKWKIGSKNKNNGVLILFAKTERKIRIEVGYGLEGAIPDSVAGRIIDASIDDLKKDNFDQALKDIFTAVAVRINQEYDLDNDQIFSGYDIDPDDYDTESNSKLPFEIISFIIILIVVISSFGGGGSNGRRRRIPNIFWYGGGGGGFGGGSSGGGGFSGGGGSSGGGGASRGF